MGRDRALGLTRGAETGADAAPPAHSAAYPAADVWLGPLLAIVGVLGFSFKAILIKLAYGWASVDPVVLMTLRMLYSAPFFALLAWWAGRTTTGPAIRARDWRHLVALGFVGYYLSSLLDFVGLQYVTASLERLVLFLYPTVVVVLSAMFLHRPITRRAVIALVLSYAGIALAVRHDIRLSGDATAIALGSALIFAGAITYAIYLVGAGPVIARLGSARFIAWAMLLATIFICAHFALTHSLAALAVPARIQMLCVAMAIFSTVLPTWMMAEAVHRMGAGPASLVGSLGPVFTLGLGAVMLGERISGAQLAGVALVLVGVVMVSRRPSR
ncbi:MAG TPA: DMT family transporter [Casimicrobiaceae bacterium]